MEEKEQQNEKETSGVENEKISDKIIEETMKEILADFADTEESGTTEKPDEPKESEEAETAENIEKSETETKPDLEEKPKSKAEIKAEEKNQEESYEEKLLKHRKKKKMQMIFAGIAAAVCVFYFGMALFFVNHFYFGTKINDVSFSCKTVQNVESHMKQQVENYVFTLNEKDGKQEQIKGTDIALQYKKGNEIEKALKKQNPFLWITALFGSKSSDVIVEVDYNKEHLDQIIAGLNVLKEENQIAPKAAMPVFNGEQFEIQDEVYGTLIDQEKFQEKIHEYVGQFKSELDLEKEGCYVLPKFTKDSPEVAEARDSMNSYLNASVTYKVEPAAEVVDKSLISQWLTVDGDMKVTFLTDAVAAYIDELCEKYNTVGKVRTITTPTGKTAEVSGGTYGWKLDRDAELAQLMNNITAGEVVTREPIYAQTAASHGTADWGTTYLEVDLSTQHMWYVVNGAVTFEADVITGMPTPKKQTPQGVYHILEKLRGKILTGEMQPNGQPEYKTRVEYWMRVTWTGIGFHDATWQRAFGGELYKSRGSHGCINMSYGEVGRLYDMVEKGCPVVIHY